jgi:hypothetical protein
MDHCKGPVADYLGSVPSTCGVLSQEDHAGLYLSEIAVA